MTTLTNRPMSFPFVEFDELYARHLCRHSQLGVNVIHLIALFAIWYAVYGLLYWAVGIEWVLAVPALIYLVAVAPNVSIRIVTATALFLALIIAAALMVSAPWWVYLVIILASYQVQSWSHRIYTIETDMTEFNRKYQKGFVLFVVLLVYEVPIALNFLLFAPSPEKGIPEYPQEDQGPTAAKAS